MVHQYRNNGYNIVLDVDSGSVHLVDDVAYDVIKALNEDRSLSDEDVARRLRGGRSVSSIDESLREVRSLISTGQLFTEDIYRDLVSHFSLRPTFVKALCLHIAHDCNLSCRYCFAREGEYHGRRALMSFDVGKKALDFLVKNSGDRRNLEVDFFGGEPLMNFRVIEELVSYGHTLEKLYNKHFRFTITTNGVLLNDEIMDFCNRECDNVVMSLDGRRNVHDRMRPFRGGRGSYDLVVPKFQKFASQRKALGLQYYIRGTFTHYNLDFVQDILHFAELGFDRLSMEPVIAEEKSPYAIRYEDVPVICNQYDILAKEVIRRQKEGGGFTFFHFLIDLTGGPCVYKRLSGCGSGTQYMAVTPVGDLYPCHQFVGINEFLLGNVYEGVKRPDIIDSFKQCNVYSRKECSKCFARYFCSGGCAANSFNFHGTIGDVYEIGCMLERKRVECALMIQAALSDRDEDLDEYEACGQG